MQPISDPTPLGTDLPGAQLSAAHVSAVIAMAWQDDVSFEAIAAQFGLSEAEVVALMRGQLKARSFKVWRMRVRGRVAKHLALQTGRNAGPRRVRAQEALAQGLHAWAGSEDLPLPPSDMVRAALL